MLNLQEEHILIDYFKTCVAAGDRVDHDKVFDLFMRIYKVEDKCHTATFRSRFVCG